MCWQPLSGPPRLRLGGCLGLEFHASGEDRTWVAPSSSQPCIITWARAQLGTGDWVLPGNFSERSLEVEAEDYSASTLVFLMEHLSCKSVLPVAKASLVICEEYKESERRRK